jgi:hypothetical protein
MESKEPTSVETESVAVYEKVPKEETAVKTVSALKRRYRDRHPAAGRHRQLKKRTQGDGGSRKKLAAASRGMTRRAIPAPRKGNGHQGPGRDNVARGAPKGQTFERTCRAQPECNNGIRSQGLKERLRLESRRTLNKVFRQTVELEIRLWNMRLRTLLRGRPLRNERKDCT